MSTDRNTITTNGRSYPYPSLFPFRENGAHYSLYGGLGSTIGGLLDIGAPYVSAPVRIEVYSTTLTLDATLNVVGALVLQERRDPQVRLEANASVIYAIGPVAVLPGGTLSVVGNVQFGQRLELEGGTVDLTHSANGLGQGVRFDTGVGNVLVGPMSIVNVVDFRAGDTITAVGVDSTLPFYHLDGDMWWIGTTVGFLFDGAIAPGATYTATPDGKGNTIITTTAQPAAPIGFADDTTGVTGSHGMRPSSNGGPAFLRWSYIEQSTDAIALATEVPNAIVGGFNGGTRAIQVTGGQNVLDGGTGSAFMQGGSGADTFFADLRGADPIWDTLVNFHQGAALTLWGWDPAAYTTTVDPRAGAAGSEGATLRVLDHSGAVRCSITFAGLAADQVSALQASTGTQAAGSYLNFYDAGI